MRGQLNWGLIVGIIFSLLIWTLIIGAVVAHAEDVNMGAIAKIESNGNPRAWNKKENGRGLYQINPICLEEWNNFHPTEQYTEDELFDPRINTRIAEWYMQKRIPQMLRHYKTSDTVENRIVAFNAGIGNAIKGRIPQTTKKYIAKYKTLVK